MNGKNYFDKGRLIALTLNEEFEKYLSYNKEYKLISNDYLRKKIHFNGMQFWAGFESVNSDLDIKNYLLVPILIEYSMLRAYKPNRLFGEKDGVWKSKETIKQTIAQEQYMRSLQEQLKENLSERLNSEEQKFVNKYFNMINKNISKGLMFEREKLNFKRFNIEDILRNWNVNHAGRNVCYNLVYDFSPLIGFGLASKQFDIVEKYIKKMKPKLRLSYMGQMINDLSDFQLQYDSLVKKEEDNFADLREGIMTYPIKELVNEPEIIEAMKNPKITYNETWRKKVLKRLSDFQINNKVKLMACDSYKANINFWLEQNIHDDFLQATYGLLIKSKYITK